MTQQSPRRFKTPWGAIGSLVLAVLYGVSPIDLIPDIIPLIGWTDDATVAGVLILLALRILLTRSQRPRELRPVKWRGKS